MFPYLAVVFVLTVAAVILIGTFGVVTRMLYEVPGVGIALLGVLAILLGLRAKRTARPSADSAVSARSGLPNL